MIFHVHLDRVRTAGTAAEHQALREELTYDLGPKRRGAGRLRMALYDPLAAEFPIGLLREAEAALRARGVPVATTDLRARPAARRGLPLAWLDPHQREATEAAIRAGVGTIKVPTAGGKGEVIAALCWELPIPWLVLCEDKSVLHQLGADLHPSDPRRHGRIRLRTGELPARVGDSLWEPGRRVVVAMCQTLHQHWDGDRWSPQAQALLSTRRGVIFDEAHGSASARGQLILRALGRCYWRVGLSATPAGRSDGRDAAIRAQLGPVVYSIGEAELEAGGKIAGGSVRMVRLEQPDAPPYEAGGYQKCVALSRARAQVCAAIWQREGPGNLTFVWSTDHGRYLLSVAQALGIPAAFLHGEHDTEERREAIARWERGEVHVLICSDVLRQGADLIHCYSGINAAGMRASIPVIQRRGRGKRVCRTENCPRCAVMGKKTDLTWYDFDDVDPAAEDARRTRRKTLPGDWLRRHTAARRRAYEDLGIRVEMITAAQI